MLNYEKKNRKEHVYRMAHTVPEATVSWEYVRSKGVDVTWTPKNVAVLRNVSFTVEFVDTIAVATPEPSAPAWITNWSNKMLCNHKRINTQIIEYAISILLYTFFFQKKKKKKLPS